MDRIRRLGAIAALVLGLFSAHSAKSDEPRGRLFKDADGTLELVVLTDRDDDDDDGIADLDEKNLSGDAGGDIAWIIPATPRVFEGATGDAVRLVLGDKPTDAAALVGKKITKLGVQGVRPGKTEIRLKGLVVTVNVLDVLAIDQRGDPVDFAKSHASISRTLPAALGTSVEADDVDALRWVVAGDSGTIPQEIDLSSARPDGRPLDAIGDVELAPAKCPASVGAGFECRASPLIRATGDVIDRSHPDSSAHSLVAEVGGRILVGVGKSITSLRVGGPRKTALGPLERFRARLRVRLVRLNRGGSPPVGGDDTGALAIGREEVRIASGLWGQCGIHFGNAPDVDVAVVDPPPAHLIAIGCDLGMPASGGEIAFAVEKSKIHVPTVAGQTPTEVASAVAAAVKKAGFRATVSANALIAPGALRTADVVIRKHDGNFAALAPLEGATFSSDATLTACAGEVDLSDGLTHFTDFDAVAGTVEERSLIKAFDDGDPTTIEVFVVPSFARTGRIGESFIYADGSSVRNVVIIDRSGIRAGARSFALAHELGHILLDMPGHPDDYGVDQPTLLMDADAADPTIFGPRRLTIEECERAVRQSGPDAPVPLFERWPLTAPNRVKK